MGKRKRRQGADLPLFDLPLHASGKEAGNTGTETPREAAGPQPEPEAAPAEDDHSAASASQLDLLELSGATGEQDEAGAPEVAEAPREKAESSANLGDRWLGGLADLAMQLLMLGLAIAACHWQGIAVTLADWMPFSVLILAFSFLYWVVPLAFWGQTPGMAWVGHTAKSSGDQPLTFGQAFLRWLGAVLTMAVAGLPLLLALTGRSLTDRLSGSKTLAGD